jgi:hypothetical protein
MSRSESGARPDLGRDFAGWLARRKQHAGRVYPP